MNGQYLEPTDKVEVQALDDAGHVVFTLRGSGYRRIGQAIESALQQGALDAQAASLAFRVTDLTTGVSQRYRYNAHGNLVLEE